MSNMENNKHPSLPAPVRSFVEATVRPIVCRACKDTFMVLRRDEQGNFQHAYKVFNNRMWCPNCGTELEDNR